MRFRKSHIPSELRCSQGEPTQRGGMHWIRIGAAIGLVTVAMVAAQQSPPSNPPSNGSATPAEPGPGRAWGSNPDLKIPVPQTGAQDREAANVERKKQIADDSAKLLKLATDLKAEVDKTNKDTLSLNVIRKADEIEKLAHDVKEKMKLTAGPG